MLRALLGTRIMSHQLLLFRHAKSDWSKDCNDFDRPISKRGKQDALNMASWMLEQKLIPDRVLASPAERSLQTCHYLMQGFQGMMNLPKIDDRLYHANVETIIELISEQKESCSSLMLVGHNPDLDNFLEYLFRDNLPLTPKGKLLTTASLAVINLQGNWLDIGENSTKLLQVTRPKAVALKHNR